MWQVSRLLIILIFCAFGVPKTHAQISTATFPESLVHIISVEHINTNIYELTSPALEGRELGSEGNMKASDWLRFSFQQLDMLPLPALGDFFHHFPIHRLTPDSVYLNVNNQVFTLNQDFSPAYFSGYGSGSISSESLSTVKFADAPDYDQIFSYALDFERRGYDLIIFFTDKFTGNAGYRYEDTIDIPTRAYKHFENTSQPHVSAKKIDIPVLFIDSRLKTHFEQLESITYHVQLNSVESRTAQNIVGYIGPEFYDDLNTRYVIVTTHFDHEGMHPVSGIPFFGAVDNASGVAMMLESIRLLQFVANRFSHPIIWVARNGHKRDNAGLEMFLREYGLAYHNAIAHIDISAPAAAPRGIESPPIYFEFHNIPSAHQAYIERIGKSYELTPYLSERDKPGSFGNTMIYIHGGEYPYRNRILDSPDKVNMTQLYNATLILTELLWNYATVR